MISQGIESNPLREQGIDEHDRLDFSQNFNHEKIQNHNESENSISNDRSHTQKGVILIIILLICTLISYQFISKRGSHPQSYYNFSQSIQDMVNNADLQKIFGNRKSKEGIWRTQFLQAVQKLQITNNVKYGGQIQAQMTSFDSDKLKKQKRIEQLIKTQSEYLETNYKISEYKKKQLPFCIVVTSYQNVDSGLYLRNLNSIFMQNYTNYHVVYIDDASPDKTSDHVRKYIISQSIPMEKIKVITNKDNKKQIENIYNAIYNHCKLGQLALIVQGDDALIGTNVLNLYNAIYQRDKCAMVYSSYLQIFENSKAELGVGRQIPNEYFQKNAIRSIFQIPGKYLLSFYVDVFKSIQVDDFKDFRGYFFWFAYDRALITPLLEISYPRISIVKQILYEHRRDIDQGESPYDWNQQSRQILRKTPYKPLKFFPFIERNKYKYFFDTDIEKVI